MQFRYLKSFKKHRLNHALEKLHGKSEGGGGMAVRHHTGGDVETPNLDNSSDQVSSSNETIVVEEGRDADENSVVVVKKENVSDDAGKCGPIASTIWCHVFTS